MLNWSRGRQLTSYGNNTFEYDGLGRRIKKNGIDYYYDSQSRLIRQSNGLEFFYRGSEVIGLKYNSKYYYYRKDIQGNVIAILDSTGKKVIVYSYDAWGTYISKMISYASEDVKALDNLNPFRYRSYYYDTETGLYYLKSRYYDPAVGRFINMDSIKYADPEAINGLNLYAYCGNNPVMNVDPTGTFWLLPMLFIAPFAYLVDTIIETAILMTSDQYKAENVIAVDSDGNKFVHINNSAAFNNPIAQYVYANYLYDNVKNDDGTNFFTGDVYDIIGEWQAHNVATFATGIGMVLANKHIQGSARDKMLELLSGYHSSSVHVDMGNSLEAEGRSLVRGVSQVFKWINKIFSFDILNW